MLDAVRSLTDLQRENNELLNRQSNVLSAILEELRLIHCEYRDVDACDFSLGTEASLQDRGRRLVQQARRSKRQKVHAETSRASIDADDGGAGEVDNDADIDDEKVFEELLS
jgi:hypothetical protein